MKTWKKKEKEKKRSTAGPTPEKKNEMGWAVIKQRLPLITETI
jgi:hypothetical protein